MNARTGSVPYYLDEKCLSPEQMKVWWAKQKLGSSELLGPSYDGTTIDNQQLHAGPGGRHDVPRLIDGWGG